MTLFGINLQLEGYSVDLALNTARFLEDLGFDALFVNDHYMKPRGNNNIPDAYLMLSAIAAQTKKIRIGTAVTPIPFRPAPLMAKIVATLDNISKGRFLFGVGAGWYQPEFEAYTGEFPSPSERVSKTIEGLKLMKRMWTEETVTFEGVYYHVKEAVLLPKPVQKPHPPILIGSKAPRMCRATARLADGWIPRFLTREDYAQIMTKILEDAKKRSRSRDDFIFVHNAMFLLASSKQKALKSLSEGPFAHLKKGTVAGSSEECAQQIQSYIDIGVDMILLQPYLAHDIQEQILTLHDKIIPQLDVSQHSSPF